jgi:N-hydroxyarylamine O-acetyltransferase
MSAIDVPAFLDRIGYDGPVEPTATVLAAIHWAHLQSVPFENLDIRPLCRAIEFDLAGLEDKIVRRRRGGFCYELNGLLAEVLRAIGFEVSMVSVQFLSHETESPPFDHMGLLVRPHDGSTSYLADVGCGRSSPARPLPLVNGYEEFQPETLTSYRMQYVDGWWQFHLRPNGEEGHPEYTFTLTPRTQKDFAERCRYLDRDPGSPFTRGPLCTRNLPGGRITLADGRLIQTRGADRREEEVPDETAFHAALRDHFGIDLTREG